MHGVLVFLFSGVTGLVFSRPAEQVKSSAKFSRKYIQHSSEEKLLDMGRGAVHDSQK